MTQWCKQWGTKQELEFASKLKKRNPITYKQYLSSFKTRDKWGEINKTKLIETLKGGKNAKVELK